MTERELATILAALRLWQKRFEPMTAERAVEIAHIATDRARFDVLDIDEIDDLCARLAQMQEHA